MIPILQIVREEDLILDALLRHVCLAKMKLEHANVIRNYSLVLTALLDSIAWRIFLILGLMMVANWNVWITNMLLPISVRAIGNVLM